MAASSPKAGAPAPAPAPQPKKAPKTESRRSLVRATRLDAIVVVGALIIVAGVLLGLFTMVDPKLSLPIIAGVTGTLVGTVLGGYAGYRWGASAN